MYGSLLFNGSVELVRGCSAELDSGRTSPLKFRENPIIPIEVSNSYGNYPPLRETKLVLNKKPRRNLYQRGLKALRTIGDHPSTCGGWAEHEMQINAWRTGSCGGLS